MAVSNEYLEKCMRLIDFYYVIKGLLDTTYLYKILSVFSSQLFREEDTAIISQLSSKIKIYFDFISVLSCSLNLTRLSTGNFVSSYYSIN